ncbi:MAG: succinate dehydrogenase, hydrophobic membrane anchor protein [Mangrovicoccus sp.]|nr:succinate dehydrogenase, hydrophobic membrane anchor protein [Mangrovicoccus sp.]
MAYLTDRKRAQGLGSGRQGTHHHWQMMASSLALAFIIPAFVITFGIGLGKPYEEVLAYFSRPVPAIIMALSVVVIINHAMQEALVAVEDYVHGTAQKITLMVVKGVSFTLIATGLFAIARLAL